MSDDNTGTPPNDEGTGAPPAPPQATPPVTPPDTGTKDWKAEAEKWQTLARKHEARAKDNVDAANRAKTVEEQLEEMRKTIADRDVADVKRSSNMALTQVKANLSEKGFNQADVADLLEFVEPAILLKDGEPDEGKIKKLTESLIKSSGRSTPDPDQGKGGGKPADKLDMNALIRRRAGVSK